MEVVALVLRFVAALFQLIDEVARPIPLHPFNAVPCKVDYEACYLRWMVLSKELACYQLTS
jgi:hypothetical protein